MAFLNSCSQTVLPTPGKTFRPDQPKNSASGEKVLPPTKNILIEAYIIFSFFLSDSKCQIVEKN
jgi:hypothetical protein